MKSENPVLAANVPLAVFAKVGIAVNESAVSLLIKLALLIPSSKSASKPEPEPSLPVSQIFLQPEYSSLFQPV